VVENVFIALLNPILALVFSGIMFVLWTQRKDGLHMLLFSVAYLSYAVAFLFQLSNWPFGDPGNPIVSHLLFTATFLALIHGLIDRRGRQTPVVALGLLAFLGLSGLMWFAFVVPDITGRIYSLNFAYGGMLLIAAAEIRAFPDKKPVERLLLAVVLTCGLYVFARTVGIALLDGHIRDRAEYLHSLTWLVLNFSAALFALLIALTLISMAILDAMEDLRRDSMIDMLSGLWNRRGFEEQAHATLADAGRSGLPAVLIIGDLDHFKTVNDRFGHACGDALIAAFADCLREAAVGRHVTARVGGEEFAIVLYGAGLMAGRLFAEAIRNACTMLKVASLPEDQTVTVSFGVAEMRSGEDLASLMRRTDAALYEAKRRGRNRVRVAAADDGRRRHSFPAPAPATARSVAG
jgi:diguanylate cyclase (GGDEF)-like protein